MGATVPIPDMAYSPIDRAVLTNPVVAEIARRRDATAAQIALAWVLRQQGVLAIPKGASLDHVRENRAALDIHLTRADLADLDREFPQPRRKVPLEMT